MVSWAQYTTDPILFELYRYDEYGNVQDISADTYTWIVRDKRISQLTSDVLLEASVVIPNGSLTVSAVSDSTYVTVPAAQAALATSVVRNHSEHLLYNATRDQIMAKERFRIYEELDFS